MGWDGKVKRRVSEVALGDKIFLPSSPHHRSPACWVTVATPVPPLLV